VSELEALISKYLDGELSPDEVTALRRALSSSPDALAIYREMTAIRRAARRAPTLRPPSASTESRLFRQLELEGLGTLPSRTPASPAAQAPVVAPIRRRVAVLASLVAVVLVAIGSMLSLRTGDNAAPAVAVDVPTQSSFPRSQDLAALAPAPVATPDDRSSAAVRRRSSLSSASASVVPHARRARRSPSVATPSVVFTAPAQPDVVPPSESSQENMTPQSEEAPAFAAALPDDSPRAQPELLPLRDRDDRRSIVSAAFRVGGTYVDRGSSSPSEDLSAGLDFDLGGGHHLAFVGGRSAAVTEERAINTLSVPARAAIAGPKEDGARLSRVEEAPEPLALEIGQEWWVGVGYNFSLPVGRVVELGAGVRGGVGERSLRVGAELQGRVNVSSRIALELVPSATHVLPHTRTRSENLVESVTDGYLYEAESAPTAFSTYGVAVGIRIALD
jgi:hypothetical protein